MRYVGKYNTRITTYHPRVIWLIHHTQNNETTKKSLIYARIQTLEGLIQHIATQERKFKKSQNMLL